ncbi:surface lipoprotein assembly modifier [Pasteurella testudinis]|nr:surface lipoprotein assembly modifier [Pasteurella testudinis]
MIKNARTLSFMVVACFSVQGVYANPQDDQAVRLWQQHEQQLNRPNPAEQSSLTDEITLDGQSFEVENNAEAIGQALYIALNQNLWHYVAPFLSRYKTFPTATKELIWFAEGALAREQKQLDQAEHYYRLLLNAQPDFVRGQLDLARILFENHKNREATALFTQLRQAGLPPTIEQTLQQYQYSVKQRDEWQGTLSVGYQYSANINQSSRKNSCLLMSNHRCLVERTAPTALNAKGWRYDLALQKHTSVSGNHGIQFSLNSYGQFYPHQHQYSENTLRVYGGYHFQNAKTALTLAPLVEYQTSANHKYQHGVGLLVAWSQELSARYFFNLQLEQKYQRYATVRSGLDKVRLNSAYATLYYSLSERSTLFAGADWTYRNASDDVNRYYLRGIRAGINHQFRFGLNTTLIGLWRITGYQGYSAALEAKRRDRQQIYMAIFKVPKWEYHGITPNLTLKHTRNRSNVDWLYSYKQNEIQFNLEFRF